MKKYILIFLTLILSLLLISCGKEDIGKPTDIQIEEGIKQALKEDGVDFDKISNLQLSEVEVTEEDMTLLKEKYASKVEFIKYESTFSLVSVTMDMTANYSAIFVYNNGTWNYSLGYITNKDEWTYQEKEASRVDKQRMLSDLKEIEFASFEKGYVGNTKYSSIDSIVSREYDETVHRDVIETSIAVETSFAKYNIPVKMIYYFNKGEWLLGDIEISDVKDWKLTYNSGSAPDFLSDSVILSYLTTDTNFLTYICNLNFADGYEIKKESEIASKESVDVIYKFSVNYDYIGTINYNVSITYQWLNNEWSDAEPLVIFRDADFSEMLKYDWNCSNGSSFKFSDIETTEEGIYKLKGKYSNNNSVDIISNLTVPLRDNNWDATITDINDNQIWDIPASEFSLNLEYGAIVYNNELFAPIEITIIDNPEPEQTEINTSNGIVYNQQDITCDNQITKDNLLFKDIVISYLNESINVSGTVSNLSDGQTSYKIGVVLFDEDDKIITEGAYISDTQLTVGSSSIVSVDIPKITDDINNTINKITIYVSK